uniref:Uncharacterized protein n=1 Tax=Roseihalotalea indica TaxID=2867963 RepID=A0AA49GT54_9BACT|nr:hypothetical protein K4G66_04970 [Tunicatimonas sp. TK19036]
MDTVDNNVLQNRIGESIRALKYESVFLQGVLEEKYEVLFVKFDKWIQILFDDGVVFIKEKLDDLSEYESASGYCKTKLFDLTGEEANAKKLLGLSLIDFSIKVVENRYTLELIFEQNHQLLFFQEFRNGNFSNVKLKIVCP